MLYQGWSAYQIEYGRSDAMLLLRRDIKDTVASILVACVLLAQPPAPIPSFTLGKPTAISYATLWRGTHAEGLGLLADSRVREPGSRSSSSVSLQMTAALADILAVTA